MTSHKNEKGNLTIIILIGATFFLLFSAVVMYINSDPELSLRYAKTSQSLFSKSTPKPTQNVTPTTTPEPTPSEQALNAAAWLVAHTSKEQLQEATKNNPDLGNTAAEIVNNIALYLTTNPASLALLEAEIEKYSLAEQKAANQKTIIYKEAPQLFNSIHCTSTTLYGTTTTNCY